MIVREDGDLQLIDLPPLCDEYVEPWVYDSIRTADLVWLVMTAEGSLEGLELTERLLGEKAVALLPVGAHTPEEPRPGWMYKPPILVLTGLDRPDAEEDVELLDRLVEVQWNQVPVSSISGEGLEELRRRTFEALGVMRVYSKQPGKDPDLEQPFTLPVGSTVGDLARLIHLDLAAGFKFARIWGPSAFDGQKVQAGHVLEEGDVVEIHF